MANQKVHSARCFQCTAQVKVVVQQIVDAQDLAMKAALLQGRIHQVHCPKCQALLIPAVPTLYYDGEKQLVFVFAPATLHLIDSPQERTIAELSSALQGGLTAEQRRTLPLPPQRYQSLEAMVTAIFQADGIDPQVVQIQLAKAALIKELLQAANEAELKAMALAQDEALDYDFFELLTASMQAAQLEGDHVRAQTLLGLRTILSQTVSEGQAIVADIDANLGLEVIQNREALLAQLLHAQSEEARTALVEQAAILIDQSFFQLLNADLEEASIAGDQATAANLRQLSNSLFELKAAQEAKERAAIQRAHMIFQAVVQSDKPDLVLRKNLNALDDSFFIVLGAHIERARRQGQQEPVQALEMIGKAARAMLQEN
jgi:hypothetical protein